MRRERETSPKSVRLSRAAAPTRKRGESCVEGDDARSDGRRLEKKTRDSSFFHARVEVFARGFALDEGPARAARGVGRDAAGE